MESIQNKAAPSSTSICIQSVSLEMNGDIIIQCDLTLSTSLIAFIVLEEKAEDPVTSDLVITLD